MKLQVVGFLDGRPIGPSRVFLRAVVFWALCITVIGLLIMLIMMLRHPRKQGWHDLAVTAVMIKERLLAPPVQPARAAASAQQGPPAQVAVSAQQGPPDQASVSAQQGPPDQASVSAQQGPPDQAAVSAQQGPPAQDRGTSQPQPGAPGVHCSGAAELRTCGGLCARWQFCAASFWHGAGGLWGFLRRGCTTECACGALRRQRVCGADLRARHTDRRLTCHRPRHSPQALISLHPGSRPVRRHRCHKVLLPAHRRRTRTCRRLRHHVVILRIRSLRDPAPPTSRIGRSCWTMEGESRSTDSCCSDATHNRGLAKRTPS